MCSKCIKNTLPVGFSQTPRAVCATCHSWHATLAAARSVLHIPAPGAGPAPAAAAAQVAGGDGGAARQAPTRPGALRRLLDEVVTVPWSEFTRVQQPRPGGSSYSMGILMRNGVKCIAKANVPTTPAFRALLELDEDVDPATLLRDTRLAALPELCYNDIYGYYGCDCQRMVLCEAPWMHAPGDFVYEQLPDTLPTAVHIVSEWIEAFRPFSEALIAQLPMHNPAAAHVDRAVPHYLTQAVEGAEVPVLGVGAILAVALFLNDHDCLGNSGGNVGFTVLRSEAGHPEAVHAIKIDPGEAFHGCIKPSDVSKQEFANAHAAAIASIRNRIISLGTTCKTSYDALPTAVKTEFLSVTREILDTSVEDMHRFFMRKGMEELFPSVASVRVYAEFLLQRQSAMRVAYGPLIYNGGASSVPVTSTACWRRLRDVYAVDSMLYDPVSDVSYPIQGRFVLPTLTVRDTCEFTPSERSASFQKGGGPLSAARPTVALADVFTKCDVPENTTGKRHVCIVGGAGYGKSTLCQTIASLWARDMLFQQFRLVVVVPLRHLTVERYPASGTFTLIDVIIRECLHLHPSPELQRCVASLYDERSVLWVLDGYDECVDRVAPHLKGLLDQMMYAESRIVTSRPHALQEIRSHVTLDITGFTDDNIQAFVKLFAACIRIPVVEATRAQLSRTVKMTVKRAVSRPIADGEIAAAAAPPAAVAVAPSVVTDIEILAFVRSSPVLWDLARVPVMLVLLCNVYSRTPALFADAAPNLSTASLTAVYTQVIAMLQRRFVDKFCTEEQRQDVDTLEWVWAQLFIALSRLALECTMDGGVLITGAQLYAQIDRVGLLESGYDLRFVLDTGFLVLVDGDCADLQQCKYQFIHLTVQEYFAAKLVIASCYDPAAPELAAASSQRYNGNLHTMWLFAAGLLLAEVNNNGIEPLEQFIDLLTAPPDDIGQQYHFRLLLRVLEEGRFQFLPAATIASSGKLYSLLLRVETALTRAVSAVIDGTASTFELMWLDALPDCPVWCRHIVDTDPTGKLLDALCQGMYSRDSGVQQFCTGVVKGVATATGRIPDAINAALLAGMSAPTHRVKAATLGILAHLGLITLQLPWLLTFCVDALAVEPDHLSPQDALLALRFLQNYGSALLGRPECERVCRLLLQPCMLPHLRDSGIEWMAGMMAHMSASLAWLPLWLNDSLSMTATFDTKTIAVRLLLQLLPDVLIGMDCANLWLRALIEDSAANIGLRCDAVKVFARIGRSALAASWLEPWLRKCLIGGDKKAPPSPTEQDLAVELLQQSRLDDVLTAQEWLQSWLQSSLRSGVEAHRRVATTLLSSYGVQLLPWQWAMTLLKVSIRHHMAEVRRCAADVIVALGDLASSQAWVRCFVVHSLEKPRYPSDTAHAIRILCSMGDAVVDCPDMLQALLSVVRKGAGVFPMVDAFACIGERILDIPDSPVIINWLAENASAVSSTVLIDFALSLHSRIDEVPFLAAAVLTTATTSTPSLQQSHCLERMCAHAVKLVQVDSFGARLHELLVRGEPFTQSAALRVMASAGSAVVDCPYTALLASLHTCCRSEDASVHAAAGAVLKGIGRRVTELAWFESWVRDSAASPVVRDVLSSMPVVVTRWFPALTPILAAIVDGNEPQALSLLQNLGVRVLTHDWARVWLNARLCDDPGSPGFEAGVSVLRALGPETLAHPDLVMFPLNMLQHEAPEVRQLAVGIVGQFGCEILAGSHVMPRLYDVLLDDSDPLVRHAAMCTIRTAFSQLTEHCPSLSTLTLSSTIARVRGGSCAVTVTQPPAGPAIITVYTPTCRFVQVAPPDIHAALTTALTHLAHDQLWRIDFGFKHAVPGHESMFLSCVAAYSRVLSPTTADTMGVLSLGACERLAYALQCYPASASICTEVCAVIVSGHDRIVSDNAKVRLLRALLLVLPLHTRLGSVDIVERCTDALVCLVDSTATVAAFLAANGAVVIDGGNALVAVGSALNLRCVAIKTTVSRFQS